MKIQEKVRKDQFWVVWALDKISISNVQSGNKVASNVIETCLCNTDALYDGDILRA